MKRAMFGIGMAASLVVAAARTEAQAPRTQTIDAGVIDAIVKQSIAAHSTPGGSVAIEQDGTLRFGKSYGVANLATGESVTQETVFRLGSISKFVTAAGIMRLVDRRKIGLDDRVAEVLAGHTSISGLPKHITIRQLLNHTSGLAILSSEELGAFIARDARVTDSDVASALGRPLLHEAGAAWSYNNSNYRLLSWIIEKASGKPFDAYVADDLAPGLGLPSLQACDLAGGRKAKGYIAGKGAFVPDPSYAVKELLGSGGLCATANDLVRLPNALMNNGWLSADSLAMMIHPTVLPNGVEVDYGLGVRRGIVGPNKLWGHTGSGLAGGWAALAHYPDHRLTIAVLGNGSGGPDDAVTLQAKIAAAVLDQGQLRASPLDAKTKAAVAGVFEGGGDRACFTATPDGLSRTIMGSGKAARPLLHLGDAVFAREDYPLDRFIFQIRGSRAIAHRVYYDAFFAELNMLVPGVSC